MKPELKSFNTALVLLLLILVLFFQKCRFCKKNLTLAKLRETLRESIISEIK